MIQGTSHFQKVLTVLTVTYLLHVNAATDNESVIKEINKLENMVKTLQTPPELMDTLLKQLENHCHSSNRTIDQSFVQNAGKCIEKYFNVSQLADDMRAAVPEGKMDNVFRDICIKWPNVRVCIDDFFGIVNDCWQKGHKIDEFVNQVVRFYCGDDNSGERMALFFAEGGLQCMQEHGTEVKTCVESKQNFEIPEENFNPEDLNNIDFEKIPIPKKDEICDYIEQLHECASIGLRKCNDPTTENLMTSMLRQVSKELNCKKIPEINMRQAEPSDATKALLSVQSLFFALAFANFVI